MSTASRLFSLPPSTPALKAALLCPSPLCADYVQRYAKPEHLLGKGQASNQKDSEEGEDEQMEEGGESDGFLSSSDDGEE